MASGGQGMVPWPGGLLPQAGRDLRAALPRMGLWSSAQNPFSVISGRRVGPHGTGITIPQPKIPSG